MTFRLFVGAEPLSDSDSDLDEASGATKAIPAAAENDPGALEREPITTADAVVGQPSATSEQEALAGGHTEAGKETELEGKDKSEQTSEEGSGDDDEDDDDEEEEDEDEDEESVHSVPSVLFTDILISPIQYFYF